MIVVTGSNGFIGSNLIKGLNKVGITDIIAVDDHTDSILKENIVHCEIQDYLGIDEFLLRVKKKNLIVEILKQSFIKVPALIPWNGMQNIYTKTIFYTLKNF